MQALQDFTHSIITEPTKESDAETSSDRRCYWKLSVMNYLILSLCLFSFFAGFTSTNSVLLQLHDFSKATASNLVNDGEANSTAAVETLLGQESQLDRSDSAHGQEGTTMPLPQLPHVAGFDYEQPMVRTIYTLPEPQIFSDQYVVTIVLGGRENFERRQVIRESWGKGHSLYFVIGGPNADAPTDQKRLENEQLQHQDILDSIHPDSYKSLPHKLKFAYQWILDKLPETQWIIKSDDDIMVNVDAIKKEFLLNLNPKVPMVMGCVHDQLPVHRDGKWAEHKYTRSNYPFFPLGSCGHVLSHSAASYIATKKGLTYYQGEDTSVGIWLDESDMRVTWVRSSFFTNEGQCLDKPWLIRGHDITPSQMLECYAQKDQWPINKVRMNALSINGLRRLLL